MIPSGEQDHGDLLGTPTPSFGRQVRSGATWSGISTIVLRLGTFVAGVVAARLIAPEEFGVFTVALTIHAILLNISELGVSAYLVRHNGNPDRVAPTVMTISLVSSFALAGAMAAAAPYFATVLGAPAATEPIRVLALTLLLAGASAVPNALLVRSFRQDKRFVAEGASFVVSNAVLISLALMGGGALALSWSRVAGHLTSAILLILLCGQRYWPGFDRGHAPVILRFGLPLAASSLLGFAIGNVDYVVIARLLRTQELGLYFLAYNISSWPYTILAPIVASVAMPAFARIRHDPDRLSTYLSASLGGLLAIGMPATALLIALSEPLVTTVYGQKWAGAAPALAVTALYGALRIPVDLLSNLTIALGRTRALFSIQVAYALVLGILMVMGVRRAGIVGAGFAHALAISIVLLPGFLLLLGKAERLSLTGLARTALPPIGAATAGGFTAWFIAGAIQSAPAALLVGGICGSLVYAALLGRWLVRAYRSARRLLADSEEPEPGTEPEPVAVPRP